MAKSNTGWSKKVWTGTIKAYEKEYDFGKILSGNQNELLAIIKKLEPEIAKLSVVKEQLQRSTNFQHKHLKKSSRLKNHDEINLEAMEIILNYLVERLNFAKIRVKEFEVESILPLVKQTKTNKINIAKIRITQIYNKYAEFFRSKQIEFEKVMKGTAYGAVKYAVDETAKEILKREHIEVSPRGLREAMKRDIR